MRCPVCQANLPEGAKFCPQCGAKIGEEEETNPALLALAAQYERNLKENPQDTATRFNLALTYLKLKRWGAAVQQLELVCQQEPDFPDAWFLLALAHKNLGQKEKVKELVAEFIRRFPDHPKASELRRKGFESVDNPSLMPTKFLAQKGGKSGQ
ncbi:MAG: tetratricopeptide repeat protein [Candidatus Fervidibacter sp.]|uniref:tetratricopeptide repeat protein n=1 Tax=Candidatus Fervidibacter sp. TaxID=3100871 RepID=UPI00404B6D2A